MHGGTVQLPRWPINRECAEMPKTERLELRVDEEFLVRLDAWRRKQPDLPPRASAIRQLVALALRTDEKGAPGVRLRAAKGKR
jgi:hypothetical protein